MKHVVQPRNTILREANTETTPSSSPNPNSMKQRSASSRKQKWSRENAPPSDLSSIVDYSSPGKHMTAAAAAAAAKIKSPLPPRPPSSNSKSLKRKLSVETVPENVATGLSDSGVKVIVRMRPPNKEEEGEMIVQKISTNSLSISGQTFTFDSVADTEATQQDIFELVGAPLVENCLSGFNSSVFAYGQTGSGKTYTMLGPANALLEENLTSNQQGLTPRVFELLFSRINEVQIKHTDKQLEYQCRCSFLEIYNEQITDLLDPTQKHLQIREDVVKSGVYVENLTEECVCTMKDVTQLLIKGLSNRRTGATSINAESSRSHSVFTCVVESRCKSTADGISSFKTSRINLVDLAGSERQKLTGAAGERLKEAGNINRSLSQLGNLINILAEVSQTGKQRHIPYRDSRLTFLLQESLGGNAKLAMVCAISPAQSCKSETFSTLRFAQRAKAIKNKAVVNEVMQDDVNVLRDVIRQLKDELHRMKENGSSNDPNGGYSTGWNARRSLNLLKFSLNRPMTLPHIDDDSSDEEMEIVEEAVGGCEEENTVDVRELTVQSDSQDVNMEGGMQEEPQPNISANGFTKEECRMDTDVNMEEEIFEQVNVHSEELGKADAHTLDGHSCEQSTEGEKLLISSVDDLLNEKLPNRTVSISEPIGSVSENISAVDSLNTSPSGSVDCATPSNLLCLVPCEVSPELKSPTPSVSPKVLSSRKSLRTSSMLAASQKALTDDTKSGPDAVHISFAKSAKSVKSTSSNTLFTRTSKTVLASTEHLAVSLHRGLEILDSHCNSSTLRQSAFRFSFKPADFKPFLPIGKVDVGLQTSFQEDSEMTEEDSVALVCSNCKNKISQPDELREPSDSAINLQLVPVDGSESAEKSKKQVPKAVEKVLAGAFRREMALEEFCAKQTSEITQLNCLVQQYKHERECNAIIGQTRDDKIRRLESLMDGVMPADEFMEEDFLSLTNEHKEKYENHPEVLRGKLELKRVQDELERYRNFFDMGERDVLLEEIQDLRNQLEYYMKSSPMLSRKRTPLLKLTSSCDPSMSPLPKIPESTKEESLDEKFEQERLCWTETESKWISLTEELRVDLEATRSLAEKLKRELDFEKKFSEEQKEALQMAMEGHARMLEQYADLQENHLDLLARQRKIQEGVGDVKKAAAKAGVKGTESKFINALATELSAVKAELEKERRYFKDENKGLRAQLRDTAEAVQAAGELLVRLKEAEEAVADAQRRAFEAEQETEKAYKQIDKLKRKREREIGTTTQNQFPEEFEPFCDGELSKLAGPASTWFSGYDSCNI